MGDWDIAGSWSGEYAYHPAHERPMPGPAVPFTLEARRGLLGRFRGVVRDDAVLGVPAEAAIRGRVSGLRVGFRKRYPTNYVHRGDRAVTLRDHLEHESGLTISRDPPSVAIRYEGEYDPAEVVVRGTWRLGGETLILRSGWSWVALTVPVCSGDWWMRRQGGPRFGS